MIKIKNQRNDGSLFHYAHFICDCLFVEIVNDIYNYKEVIREKNINQTIGNFANIYTEVTGVKNTELLQDDYNKIQHNIKIFKKKEEYAEKKYFDKFRNFIFNKYNIEYINNENYPEVILIQRGKRINLIDDEILVKINKNITTGKERREIKDIDKIEDYLQKKYTNKFKTLILEQISFVEQIKYFNNAKFIICAHGACMSNMFFCKEGTKILEIKCDKEWKFFDMISSILKLDHRKCHINIYKNIIDKINLK